MKVGNVNSIASSETFHKPKVSAERIPAENQAVKEAPQLKRNRVSEDGHGVIDEELLEKSVHQANKTLEQHNRYIERKVHDVTKAVMYTLKDSETEEVIAEFPPEKLQDMIAKMWEIAGLVIDERG